MARKKKIEEATVIEPSSDVPAPEAPATEEKAEEPALTEKQKLLALYEQLRAMKIDNISQLEQMIARMN